jgi:ABC-type uncharacterized transport system ATPase subunit
VLFSTQVMENAERLCHPLCITTWGGMVLDGTVRRVKAEHGGRYVALALTSGVGGARRGGGERKPRAT